MIRRLMLENWKQHTHLDLNLGDGLTVVRGRNSAGKTNILKAVLFALGGASATGSKADNLWSWNPASKQRLVHLEIELPQHGLVTIQRTPSSAKVFSADGALLASGTTPVTRFVEEAYGMSWGELRTLLYSPQGEVQQLVAMGSAALQQKVESLAKVSVVDKVLELLGRDLSAATAQLSLLPQDDRTADLASDVAQLEEFVETSGKTFAEAVEAATGWGAEVDRVAAVLQQATGINAQYQGLQDQLTRQRSMLSTAQTTLNQLQAAPAPGPNEALIQQLEVEHRELSGKVAAASAVAQAYNRHQTQLNQAEESVHRLKVRVQEQEQLYSQLVPLQAQLMDMEARQAEAYTHIEAARKEKNRIEEALDSGACPTCGRDYDECFDRAELQAQLSQATAALHAAKGAFEDAGAGLPELRSQVDRLRKKQDDSVTGRLQDTVESLRQLQELEVPTPPTTSQLAEWNNRSAATALRLAELRQAKLNAAAYQSRLASARSQVTMLESGMQELEKRLAEAPPPVDCAELQSSLEVAKGARDSWRTTAEEWRQSISSAERDLTRERILLDQAKRDEETRRQVQSRKRELEELQTYLRKNRARLAADVWDGLLHYASALASAASDGQVTQLARSEQSGDFTAVEGQQTILVSELGGARRSICGLALRAAFSAIFFGPGLPLLIDEGAADADEENSAGIAGMLASLDRQVLSVSHREGEAVNAAQVVLL